MNRIFSLVLTLLFIASFTGCFWQTKHPYKAYSNGEILKAYHLGLKWLEENPNDINTRKLTGKAALMLGDTLAAYQVWKPELLHYMASDEMVSKRVIDFGLEFGDLDYLEDIIKMGIENESQDEKREKLNEVFAFVQMKKNNALYSYLQVENIILEGEYLDAYQRIREINKIYAKPQFWLIEESLRAYLLMREGTDESVAKSMKLLENVIDDPAISIPVLYISARVYYEVDESTLAIDAYEKAKSLADSEDSRRFNAAFEQLFEDIHKKKNRYDR